MMTEGSKLSVNTIPLSLIMKSNLTHQEFLAGFPDEAAWCFHIHNGPSVNDCRPCSGIDGNASHSVSQLLLSATYH